MEQSPSIPAAGTSSSPESPLRSATNVPKGLVTDQSNDPLQVSGLAYLNAMSCVDATSLAAQITETSVSNTTLEDYSTIVTEQGCETSGEDDSSQLYNLVTSILEDHKPATEIPHLDTAFYLFDKALNQHPGKYTLGSNSLSDLAGVLANSMQTRSEQSGQLQDLDKAISLYRHVIELLPAGHPSRSDSLDDLGDSLWTRFEQSGQLQDLDESISRHRDALELRPAGHPYRSGSLNNLAISLQIRFEQSGQLEDLDKAISLHRDALELFPAGDPNRSTSLHSLAISLQTRFERSGQLEDLEEAISVHRDALELRPAGHPDQSTSFNNLGTSLQRRFEQSGRLEDLDEAIALRRDALELRPAGHPDQSTSLNDLGTSLQKRFEQSGQLEVIDEAIALHRDALELRPAGHPNRSGSLYNLANSLKARFEQSGQLEDLGEAVSLHRDVLELRPTGHANRSHSLNDLGNSLRMRFERSGQLEDLDEAISLHRDALGLQPVGYPDQSGSLNSLGHSLQTRFEQSGQLEDLEEAISLHRDALKLRPAGHPNRSTSLNNLACSLETRFEQSGRLEDLDEAISLHRDSLEPQSADHLDRSSSFNDLAISLHMRFEQSGRLEDLDEAISLNRDALVRFPAGHPNRSASLNNLAMSLLGRFEQSGQLEDLDEAISLLRGALELFPAGHLHRSGSLNNLAISLIRRYEQSNQLEELDEAISLHRDALELRPAGHPNQSESLDNLGYSLQRKFEQSGQLDDLDEAISLHRDALKLRPVGHPDRSSSLSNLANSLKRRSEQSGHLEDLDEAISLHRDALVLSPAGHPYRSSSLNDLACALETRFEQSGRHEDLDEAIELYPECINSETRGHPSICGFSRNFGRALFSAYSHTHELKYLDNAMATYRAAARFEPASASERFRAAKSWAQSADQSEHESAMDAYLTAIELLPRLAMLGSGLHARQRALTSGSDGLARDAAACAIRSGQYGKAVELLEEGRAIFWSQALQLRTPMSHLREVAPELEMKLKSLSFVLEQGSLRDTSRSLSDSPQKVMSMEQEARHFYRLNVEWLETLEKVRQLHEFQDFLRPNRLSTLQDAAVSAPVVILNASKSGCDCLIMTSCDVKHVPLSGLSFDFVKTLVGLMQTATARNSLLSGDFLVKINCLFQQMSFNSDATRSLRRSVEERHVKRVSDARVDPEDIFRFVLCMLWISVVRPVIDSLNLEQSENPPNLKWCPTGPFAFLPVHAAGFYYGATTESVSDYVVSSYVPTIGALLRGLTPATTTNLFQMVAVIQPQTLPYANQELRNIAARVPNDCLVKLGIPEAPATVNEVVSHLSAASIAHFACHGEQNKRNPLDSSLVLEDGRLKVSQIMQQSTPNASLAFLCACETAMGHEDLPDEAMHLGATLLFAGFRGAVATMWSIVDADGPKITDSFYEHLFKEYEMDSIGPDTTQAARALHHAVAKLRSEDVSFARWVPFIHLGR